MNKPKKGEKIFKLQQTNTMQLLKFKKATTIMQILWTVKKTAHQDNLIDWVQNVLKLNRFLFKEVKNKIGAQ